MGWGWSRARKPLFCGTTALRTLQDPSRGHLLPKEPSTSSATARAEPWSRRTPGAVPEPLGTTQTCRSLSPEPPQKIPHTNPSSSPPRSPLQRVLLLLGQHLPFRRCPFPRRRGHRWEADIPTPGPTCRHPPTELSEAEPLQRAPANGIRERDQPLQPLLPSPFWAKLGWPCSASPAPQNKGSASSDSEAPTMHQVLRALSKAGICRQLPVKGKGEAWKAALSPSSSAGAPVKQVPYD